MPENDAALPVTAAVQRGRRRFSTHESALLKELDGLPLATFGQRLLGYLIDLLLAVSLWGPMEVSWRLFVLHEKTYTWFGTSMRSGML